MTLRRAQVDDDPQTSTASGPVACSDIVFTSNTECSYVDPVSGGTWGVTIRTQADDTIRVTWTADAATKATASVTCPDSPVIPGQPGPRPLGVEPVSFVLPAAGGTQRSRARSRRTPAGSTPTERSSSPPND